MLVCARHYAKKTAAFMQCASCRFATLYFVPFFAGLVLAGHDTLGYAALGALLWIVHSLAIEVTNRLSDRTEDTINRPERTRLCEYVGWPALRAVQAGLWSAVVAIDGVWLVLAGNPEFAFLLALSISIGIAYSRGPRLARSRHVGLLVVNLVFGGVFIVGWSAGDPFSRPTHVWLSQITSFMPVLIVVGIFIVTLAGVKDLTDRAGDLRVGYRSPFVDLVEHRRAFLVRCLGLCPFALIAAFTSLDLMSSRLIALIGFAPVSIILTEAVRGARTSADSLIVREVFYNYWLAFSSIALLLLLPQKALALAVMGAISYWVLTTRWLHWGDQLHAADLMQLVRMSGLRSREHAKVR